MKLRGIILAGFLITLCSCQNNSDKTNSEFISKPKVDSLNTVIDSLKQKIELSRKLADSLSDNKHSLKTIDSLKYVILRKDVEYSALMELHLGEFIALNDDDESKPWGYQYRIEIYGSEIYKSVYLTKIEYIGEGVRQVGSKSEINLDQEIGISGEETNSLKFVQWLKDSEFQLTDGKKVYTLKIFNSNKVKVKK